MRGRSRVRRRRRERVSRERTAKVDGKPAVRGRRADGHAVRTDGRSATRLAGAGAEHVGGELLGGHGGRHGARVIRRVRVSDRPAATRDALASAFYPSRRILRNLWSKFTLTGIRFAEWTRSLTKRVKSVARSGSTRTPRATTPCAFAQRGSVPFVPPIATCTRFWCRTPDKRSRRGRRSRRPHPVPGLRRNVPSSPNVDEPTRSSRPHRVPTTPVALCRA